MTLMSSRLTFYYKRLFPLIWFGCLAFFFFRSLPEMLKSSYPFQIGYLLIPIGMAILGHFVMKKLIFDLMDEVWDSGDVLIVKNKNKEEQILLSDIMNISYPINQNKVTISLRKPCYWGKEISFYHPQVSIHLRKAQLSKS